MPSWDLNLDVGAARAAIDAARAALPDAAELVLAESSKHVPYDSGRLERSGAVVPVAEDRVAITYRSGIAAIQHERLDFHHKRGGGKFLENALNATRGEVLAHIGEATARALEA